MNKNKWHWFTDGTDDIKVYEDELPPNGFYSGRAKGCGGSTTGTFWITNGIINKCIKVGSEIPDGFYKGTSATSTKGYKFYNNGVEEKWFSKDETIPADFKFKGRLNSDGYKQSAANRKKRTVNDGISNYKILESAPLPEGYFEGSLPRLSQKEKIAQRDANFEALGYIPFKALTVKQRSTTGI